jgi:HlyD family secretion protein
MKKPLLITAGIFAAFLLLFIFNKLTSKNISGDYFTEAMKGNFEIAVTSSGELVAEKSIDIMGPEIVSGRDVRASQVEIQDLIAEGTMVKKGDYIGSLNRTEFSNQLKDAQERLATMQSNLEMRVLDTAVQLNSLRDQIKNQEFTVEEREMTLRNSKFEPPTVIRQAQINVEQSKNILEQVRRNYVRRAAQMKTDIYNQKTWIGRMERRIADLEELIAAFTVTAPADGMVIYKRDFRGNKRKTGSRIDPRDRVIATLPDLSSMMSRVFVSEIEVSKLKPGQTVEVVIDAYPNKRYTGKVQYVGQIGEKMPNTSDKMFEVLIRIDGSDPNLRPSMTTSNRIIVKSFEDAVFVPVECIRASADSVPYVYRKNGVKQIVLTGDFNDKNIIIEQGVEEGTMLYLNYPEKPEKFRVQGEDLIPVIKDRYKSRRIGIDHSARLEDALSDLK